MKLFEFLETVSKEKFPFRLEYQEWSGSVKVIVDTFSKIEEYCFDQEGMWEYGEYLEGQITDDKHEMQSKINDLINRPEKVWIDAANDLGIEFIYPYNFIGIDGQEYQVTGLLPEFGDRKGVMIMDRKTDADAVLMADLTNEYEMAGLSSRYYDKYDRESFIETLSEWGWKGDESKKPNWIKED